MVQSWLITGRRAWRQGRPGRQRLCRGGGGWMAGAHSVSPLTPSSAPQHGARNKTSLGAQRSVNISASLQATFRQKRRGPGRKAKLPRLVAFDLLCKRKKMAEASPQTSTGAQRSSSTGSHPQRSGPESGAWQLTEFGLGNQLRPQSYPQGASYPATGPHQAREEAASIHRRMQSPPPRSWQARRGPA